MGRFDKKEPKLNEVKAVLQRLQGFPEDEQPAGPLPANGGARWPPGGAVVATIIFGLAGAILGAAYLFGNLTTSNPQKTAAVEATGPPPYCAIGGGKGRPGGGARPDGQGAGARGARAAARARLEGSPDAAWDVARSYDPNVLATLPQPDAPPDIPEASRWYRTWYEIAVKEGMVANSVSIERIIGAMQRSAQR